MPFQYLPFIALMQSISKNNLHAARRATTVLNFAHIYPKPSIFADHPPDFDLIAAF